MTTKPYEGLRVVDFSTTLAGPHCTRMLADMGAEVVKIEPPEGEMMRIRPPVRNGESTLFGHLNVGKKSVVIDLKSTEGARAARRLALEADVLVENFRPGVMQRLGLDFEVLCNANPRLIYCSISGYGQTGPSAELPAYAPVIHAAAGYDMAHLRYQEGRQRPDYCGIYVADVLAGTYAFGAIGVALHVRASSGLGTFIDVSMLESVLSMMPAEVQQAQFHVPMPSRPLFGPIETVDGYVMLAVGSEKTFKGISDAAGRPDILDDPRFRRYPERRANWGALMEIVEQWSRKLTSEECLRRLAEHGLPASLYRTVAEAMSDPQLVHRGALADVEDSAGTFKTLNSPFQISGADTTAGKHVPRLGEHTCELLGATDHPGADSQTLSAAGGVGKAAQCADQTVSGQILS